MVAIAISMVAMVALLELYANTRQTYRLQAMQSRLSEDGRFTVSMLQRLVGQANYRNSQETITTPVTATSNTSTTIKFNGDGINTITCDGSLTNVTGQTITISQSTTTLQCTDTNTAAKSANWIAASSGGNGTELADFRIGYGIDTAATYQGAATMTAAAYQCGSASKDCVADSYVYGTTTESIVAIRFCFVLRSESTDSSITRSADVNKCDGTAIANSQNDRKLYRTFNTTVLLKNR